MLSMGLRKDTLSLRRKLSNYVTEAIKLVVLYMTDYPICMK